MNATDWIQRHGGIAHRRELRDAGLTAYHLRGLRTVGRRWVIARGAPTELIRAAAEGGRLACVSAAAHLGLSMLHPPETLHLSVAPNSPRAAGPGIRLHRSRPILPTRFSELVESVPDVLSHVAQCLPEAEALVIWESALHRRLLDRAFLERIAWPGPRQRRLVRIASDQSDSVLESLFGHQLREVGVPFQQQARLLGRPVDFLIGERLVVQLDGFEHHQAAQRRSDIAFDAELKLRGRHVLRFDYAQTVTGAARAVTLRAIAQGLHYRAEGIRRT